MIDLEDVWSVDYLSLINKHTRRENSHFWYDFSHITFCREHLDEYYAGIERRNQLSRRVSKLHKAYRQKKRGW